MIKTRKRYQGGSVELRKRADGNHVWMFRWTEGARRPGKILGNITELPNESAALKAAATLRYLANASGHSERVTFRAIIGRYKVEELPPRFSTRKAYLSNLKNHIEPQWGDHLPHEIKPAAVSVWLRGLDLSGKTQFHLRGLMRVLFEFAMAWELIDVGRNPMELVRLRKSIRRETEPRILTVDEFHLLLKRIQEEPFRTMLLLDMCLGLRCSELLGLKWCDFDWKSETITVCRSVVDGRVDTVKTKYSNAPVPLDLELAMVMQAWKRRTEFNQESDWVFASPYQGGTLPYQSRGVQLRLLKPCAIAAGLGPLGWHDLRHTYKSWLDGHGTAMGVQKDLMRHSSIQTTMNTYGGSLPNEQRTANSKVVSMVFKKNA